jgi:DNA replication protein DnaC
MAPIGDHDDAHHRMQPVLMSLAGSSSRPGRDLLEIVEDRYGVGSLIITSQVPVDHWYEIVGNPTLADAILDRIIHNTHRIELHGETLRKPRAGG